MTDGWFGLFGVGGHAREVMSSAQAFLAARPQLGVAPERIVFVDRHASGRCNDIPVLGEAEFYALEGVKWFHVGIGDGARRSTVAGAAEAAGCRALSIHAENAAAQEFARLGAGCFLAPFSSISNNVQAGAHLIANTHASVAHDCVLGDFVTLGPKACLNGNVHVEDFANIGSGALIRQGAPGKPLRIGRGAVIGMGAVVVGDVPSGAVVAGNPARPMESRG